MKEAGIHSGVIQIRDKSLHPAILNYRPLTAERHECDPKDRGDSG